MGWPQSLDFAEAVQSTSLSFCDKALKGEQPLEDAIGLPLMFTGKSATVFQMKRGNQAWAVKCFTRPVRRMDERYRKIIETIEKAGASCLISCEYREAEVTIGDGHYPIVKMPWQEGLRLNEFVSEQIDNCKVLTELAVDWLAMLRALREINIAHGDLQHGNVLVVREKGEYHLRLVDYDGMYVPPLEGSPPGECGHSSYQHPQRRMDDFSSELDRFPGLVVYTLLRALAYEPKLLEKHYDADSLGLTARDYHNPDKSLVLSRLLHHPEEELQFLGRTLRDAARGPLNAVPDLLELPELR